MKLLYLIPARGGSKGIPKKNIKPLAGKPLIQYSIEIARSLTSDENICVSSDDNEIINFVLSLGLKVPFVRPHYLAKDDTPTNDVIIHALNFYQKQNITFDAVVLLQPTSPFRLGDFVREAINLYRSDIDMVVSVTQTKSNPYYVLFEENENGFLIKSKQGNFTRRQDCPKVYEINGSIYIINVLSILKKGMQNFNRILKYEMERLYSIDLDDELDWAFAEFLIYNKLIKL